VLAFAVPAKHDRGRLASVMPIDVADGVVQTVRSVINPDKVRRLGPLADVCALMRRRGEHR
jgi:RNA polymerase sigma-70 factor, ECF subfamily